MRNKSGWSRYLLVVCLTFGVLFQGCQQKPTKIEEEPPEVLVQVPDFNADSAYYFVQQQVEFGPRIPNSSAHLDCGNYLISTLERWGGKVVVQEFESKAFDGTLLNLRNIIASYNPDQRKRILIAAHWDTRPWADKDTIAGDNSFDGANDSASGIGILLEIARILNSSAKPQVGVDLFLLDGEDYGLKIGYKGISQDEFDGWCLGSRYWSQNKHKPGYSAYYGIVLDMVGGEGARFFQEGFSLQYAPKVVKKIWQTAHKIGYGDYFIFASKPGITDDHLFINKMAKIPTINIVPFDPGLKQYFGSFHHTRNDNMELIAKTTLKAVGQTVLHSLYQE